MFGRTVFSIWLLLWLGGCDLPRATTAPAIVAGLGEEFVLQVGETARLPDAGAEVTFVSVPADGRCPINIDCAETAPVRIALRIEYAASGDPSELELSAHTGTDGVVNSNAPGAVPADSAGVYLVSLLRVAPYPDADRSTRPGEYVVTLRVTETTTDTQVVTP